MRKISFQIAAAALILVAVCVLFRAVRGNTIVDVMRNPGFADQVEWSDPPSDLTITYDEEGVGDVTKWWFWPNAFMRECIGLMANRVRQEMVLLVLTVIISAALSYFMIR